MEHINTPTPEAFVPKKNEYVTAFLTPAEASQKAAKIEEQILFLESIKDKVNKDQSLNEAEEAKRQELFGDKQFKNGEIGWDISFLEHRHYQTATAGINGASFVAVGYPTGAYYEESAFTAQMRQNEEKINSIYHEAGTEIDRETARIATEYNKKTAEPTLGWPIGEPHARRWFTVSVQDNATMDANKRERITELTFGGTTYAVYKENNGTWACRIKEKSLCFADAEVCEKLDEVDKSVAVLIATRANQAFR